MGAYKDLTGKTFNNLLVLKDAGRNKDGMTLWKCRCVCGNDTVVSSYQLTSGGTKSCGCLQRDKSTKHGFSDTKPYQSYLNMITRCTNVTFREYHNYGGKKDHPTKITKLWYDPDRIPEGETIDIEGLKEFVRWSYEEGGYYDQPKDTPKMERLSIERKDVNGDYEPSNCEWIPLWKQAQNKRNNRWIYDGEEWLIYANFERKYNLDEGVVRGRLWKGHTIDEIIYEAKTGINILHGRDKDGFLRLIKHYDQNTPRK